MDLEVARAAALAVVAEEVVVVRQTVRQ